MPDSSPSGRPESPKYDFEYESLSAPPEAPPEQTDLTTYTYDKLKHPDALRLLRLRPAKEDYLDIDCEIEIVKLEDKKSFEAVSWYWGKGKHDQVLRVHKGDNVFAFYVSENLKSALRALRRTDTVRFLWIDAICINQKNMEERNQQVPKMDRIYGKSTNVCIWLGKEADNSKRAMDFVKVIVQNLWKFDKLIENSKLAPQWAALITLMKRPWFSRRWVVQEIALSASGGIVYCGKEEVPWQDFADAVSLFVEVESATHRISDVMKRDQLFENIPDFFGDVPSLGAALLVEATSNLFRKSSTGDKKPLSTLEYLVSRLSVFDATQPRDTIYALLAISQDTTPHNLEQQHTPHKKTGTKVVKAFASKQNWRKQPYNVDYKLPVMDVYQAFIDFSIRRSEKVRALDIICRPWAPAVRKSHDLLKFQLDPSLGNRTLSEEEDPEVPLPSWIPHLSGAAFEMEEHPVAGLRMERQNADTLVGLPGSGQTNYSAAGDKAVNLDKLKFVKWDTLKNPKAHYPDYSMFVEGFILDEVVSVEQIASNGNLPFQWLGPGGWHNTDKHPPEEFWRTLVADRGPGGSNPPTYFPRACRESMKFKAKTKSKTRGNLDSKKLINEGRCTIVAEFLRRVQAVIWNRLLMKTKEGRLGLVRDDVKAGYKICILYGCSVPVILQEFVKTDQAVIDKEHEIHWAEWLKKRERVVIFFQARWRMLVFLKAQKKAKAAEEEAKLERESAPDWNQPAQTKEEALKWLTASRRTGTWPPKSKEKPKVRDTTTFKQNAAVKKDSSSGTRPPSQAEHGSQTPSARRTSRSPPQVPPKPKLGREDMSSSVKEASRSVDVPRKPEEDIETWQRNLQLNSTPLLDSSKDPCADEKDEGSSVALEDELTSEEKSTANITDLGSDRSEIEIERRVAAKLAELEGKKENHEAVEKAAKLAQVREKGKKQTEEREAQEHEFARPPSSYYRLFGECYVHGMMNGEAVTLQNERFMKRQMFELR